MLQHAKVTVFSPGKVKIPLMVAKFDHSCCNSPVVFKEFNNFKELSNHCAIAIEVERCGIRHQSAGELSNHCRKIQCCKIVRLPRLFSQMQYPVLNRSCADPVRTLVAAFQGLCYFHLTRGCYFCLSRGCLFLSTKGLLFPSNKGLLFLSGKGCYFCLASLFLSTKG